MAIGFAMVAPHKYKSCTQSTDIKLEGVTDTNYKALPDEVWPPQYLYFVGEINVLVNTQYIHFFSQLWDLFKLTILS